MAFIPDPYSKMVRIPIIIKNGKIEFFFNGPLPELEEGAIGELVIEKGFFKDQKLADMLVETRKVPVLKKDTILAVLLKPERDYESFDHFLFYDWDIRYRRLGSLDRGCFIKIKLDETLYLELRGTKLPLLCKAKCHSIEKISVCAESLNEMYTLLSQKHEGYRRSHSGNVFRKIFYRFDEDKRLHPLGELRENREILFREKFEE